MPGQAGRLGNSPDETVRGKREEETADPYAPPEFLIYRAEAVVGASPGFPVEVGGFGKLHAAFLNESRTRGHWSEPRGRKSGSPIFFGPRTLGRTWGTRPVLIRCLRPAFVLRRLSCPQEGRASAFLCP